MAGVHAERIAAIPDASVEAVVSPNTADEFAEEYAPDAARYETAEALCADPDVEAVDVCSPTHLHRRHVERAAEYGLDVLCEKPLARTLAGADAIADAVDEAGVTCTVAHVTRFFPEYATARQRVRADALGDDGVARTERAVGFAGERGWFGDEDKSGGVLLDLAVHDFDYLRWTLGDVEYAFSRLAEWGPDDESQSSVTTLRFESGAVAHVEATWMRLPELPFTARFELAGDEGLIEHDSDRVRPVRWVDDAGVHVPTDPVGDDLPVAPADDGYYRELAAFVECVETGADPPVTVEDGRAAMAVSLAAVESAERGEPVAPAEVEP